MKKRLIYMASASLMSTALFLTSCGGNNGDMPPESTEGDTQETGVEGTGDLPGTGAEDTTMMGTDTTGMGGTTTGTTGGGTTAGGTTGGTTTGTTGGGTTTGN